MKKTFRIISFTAALTISALMLTACGGSGSGSNTSTGPMPWETAQSSTTQISTQISTVEPSTTEPSTVQPSTVEPSTVQPSTVQPSTVEPSTVQPSTVQPSTVEPSTVQPSTVGKRSIKEALEADIGINGFAQMLAQQSGMENVTVTGEYGSDDEMIIVMTLNVYLDPGSEETRNMISNLAMGFESMSQTMAQTITMLETQYNVNPCTMEFRVCNSDGTVLYTRVFTDQG